MTRILEKSMPRKLDGIEPLLKPQILDKKISYIKWCLTGGKRRRFIFINMFMRVAFMPRILNRIVDMSGF